MAHRGLWDLKQSLAPAEAARTLWLASLFAVGGKNLPPAVSAAFVGLFTTGTWPTGQAGRDLDAFFAKNGPAWHVKNGRKLDIPVLIGHGLPDNLFNLNQGLQNFERALTPRSRARSLFVGYNAGHTIPSVVPPGFVTPGDPCSIALGSPNFAALEQRFMALRLKNEQSGLSGFGSYHLATADGRCLTQRSLAPNKQFHVGKVVTSANAGLPINIALAKGPITVAGVPRLDAKVSSLLPDAGAFFALSVGTTPLDARIVQHNTMPIREKKVVKGVRRSIDLPGIAVDVPAGKSLFLTVSTVADLFAAQNGRVPNILELDHLKVAVHRIP